MRAHVFVAGRVQGVGYRYSCFGAATKLKLAGWVKNLPDGRVEAVFEGPKEAVEKAVEWCRQGPSGARVTGVDVSWEKDQDERGFRIAH